MVSFVLSLVVGIIGIAGGLGMIAFGILGRIPFFRGPRRAVVQATWQYWKGRLASLVGGPLVIVAGFMIIAEGWNKIGYTDSGDLIRAGLKYQQKGDYDKAIEKYNQVLETKQQWNVKPAIANRAHCYIAKEMWAEAVADFERTLEKAPTREDPVSVARYAMALEKVGRRQDALIEYDRLLKYDKNNTEAQARREALLAQVPQPQTVAPPRAEHYHPTASRCGREDTVQAMCDGVLPGSSGDTRIPRMTWWGHKGTEEWVQYTFEKPRTIRGVGVYWFDDTGRGFCRVPDRWQVECRQADTWQPVKAIGPYETTKDQINSVSFEPVRTDAIRLVVQLKPNYSGGILEWQIIESPTAN